LFKKTLHENPIEGAIALPRISKIPLQMLNEMQHHKEKQEEIKGSFSYEFFLCST